MVVPFTTVNPNINCGSIGKLLTAKKYINSHYLPVNNLSLILTRNNYHRVDQYIKDLKAALKEVK